MSKLGIAIKITKEGASQPLVVGNVGDWTSRVIDVRDTLKYVTGLEGYDKVVKFLSFSEDGCLLTQVRAISGRPGDNVAAWIYIPSNIIIAGEEVAKVADEVKGQLFNSRTDVDTLEEIVSKEYENRLYDSKYKSSNKEGELAFRTIGFYPLIDILGTNRYQTYYSNYKYVFLIDESDGVVIADTTAVIDLTNEKISELCTLIAPSILSIQESFGKGVGIYYKSRRQNKLLELSSSILVNKGKDITLYAVKEGFEPQTFKINVSEVEQKCQLPLGRKNMWQKKILPAMFIVEDEQKMPLEQYVIKINGKSLLQGVVLSEQECAQVQVTVSKAGYETKDRFLDLRQPEKVEVITLVKEERSFEYEVELNNEEVGKLSFSSRKMINKSISPIVGYEWQGNRLVPNPIFVLKNRIIGALCGIGVLLALLFVSWIYSNIESSNNFPWIKWHKEVQQPRPSYYGGAEDEIEDLSQTNPSKEESIGKAAEYLDNHQGWVKSEMEQFSCLEGLFEDMNNFHLREIVGDRYAGLADASNEFKSIKEAAQQCLDNHWDPTGGGNRPTYNMAPDDYIINRINYRNWIGQSHSSQSGDGGNESFNNTHRGGTGSSGRSSDPVHAGGGGSSNSSTGNKESDV